MKYPSFAIVACVAITASTACGSAPPDGPSGPATPGAKPPFATTTGDDTGSNVAISPGPTFVPSPYGELFFAEHGGADYPAARLEGRLVVDDAGCFRLTGTSQGLGETVIWASQYEPEVEGGEVRVLDPSGRVVARVEDRMVMGGGQIGGTLDGILGVNGRTGRELEERCPGTYVFTGEVAAKP